jgi:hypothetical protein
MKMGEDKSRFVGTGTDDPRDEVTENIPRQETTRSRQETEIDGKWKETRIDE